MKIDKVKKSSRLFLYNRKEHYMHGRFILIFLPGRKILFSPLETNHLFASPCNTIHKITIHKTSNFTKLV